MHYSDKRAEAVELQEPDPNHVEQMYLSHLTHFTFWARTYVNKWNIRKSLGFQQLSDAGLKKNMSISKKT